jgi:hypothetical protein
LAESEEVIYNKEKLVNAERIKEALNKNKVYSAEKREVILDKEKLD